ncbi:Aste57867_10670 [Aphanomyces stellatus]|uniref:Aste57867_10670 protein n=1 Tax=Aphanomyces stellatus TaxID=120398 RepID=A0A485KRK1_9STRA|nr:hypothetical protein As57867_010630 [Aphanomyces stellatus]VFT87542.1 Aste57867_10670 [Aphanomyces stellatus]
MVLVPCGNVAWGLLQGYPWWPLYVLDPHKLSRVTKHHGPGHGAIQDDAKKFPKKYRLVYYFGSHDFGLHTTNHLKAWDHDRQTAFVGGYPASACVDEQVVELLGHAIREATDYLTTDRAERTLPYLLPWEQDVTVSAPLRSTDTPPLVDEVAEGETSQQSTTVPSVPLDPDESARETAPSRRRRQLASKRSKKRKVTSDDHSSMKSPPEDKARRQGHRRLSGDATKATTVLTHVKPKNQVPLNTLAWASQENGPWFPVFVCDPSQLNPAVHNLGKLTARVLEIAAQTPEYYRVAYYFGAREFAVIKSIDSLQPWLCPEHDMHVASTQGPAAIKRAEALEDAEAYVAMPGRLPYDPISEYERVAVWRGIIKEEVAVDDIDAATAVDQTQSETSASMDDSREQAAMNEPATPTYESADDERLPTKQRHPRRQSSADREEHKTNQVIELISDDEDENPVQAVRETAPACLHWAPWSIPPPTPPYLDLPDPQDTTWTLNKYVVWAQRKNYPWWPAYVCDPTRLAADLAFLGDAHRLDLGIAKGNQDVFKLVYYFGSHTFGRHPATKPCLKPWHGPDHDVLAQGHPQLANGAYNGLLHEFNFAKEEVEAFLNDVSLTRLLPYMVPSDMDATETPPTAFRLALPLGKTVWVLCPGYPWLPAFVFDPQSTDYERLPGCVHRAMHHATRRSPKPAWLVYCFGKHAFLVQTTRGTIKLWHGDDHDMLVQGYAEAPLLRQQAWAVHTTALKEVDEYHWTSTLPKAVFDSPLDSDEFVDRGDLSSDSARTSGGSGSTSQESSSDGDATVSLDGKPKPAVADLAENFKYNRLQQKQYEDILRASMVPEVQTVPISPPSVMDMTEEASEEVHALANEVDDMPSSDFILELLDDPFQLNGG